MPRFLLQGMLALLVIGLAIHPSWAAPRGGGGGRSGGGGGGGSIGRSMGGGSMGRSTGGGSMRHSAPSMSRSFSSPSRSFSSPSRSFSTPRTVNRAPTATRSPSANRAPAVVNRAPAAPRSAPVNVNRQPITSAPRASSNRNPASAQPNVRPNANANRAVQGNVAPRINAGANNPANVARSNQANRAGQTTSAAPQMNGSAANTRANNATTANRPATQPSPRINGDAASAANLRSHARAGQRPTTTSLNQHLGIKPNSAVASASNVRGNGAGRAATAPGAGNIHRRANWQQGQASNTNITRVRNNLAGAVRNGSTNDYLASNPQRAQQWNNWANNAHNHWRHHHGQYFNNRWWATHYVNRPRSFNYLGFGFGYGYPYYGGLGGIGIGFGNPYYYGGWGYPYGYGFGYRPWRYWWGVPTWGGINSWGNYGWSSPCYYDYGAGGNVVYSNSGVYLNDQLLGTPQDYAQSAADLATVDPDIISEQQGDWMALGTFAVVMEKAEADPSRILQLAIDKQGVVSGTLFNKKTDKAYAVSGRVDKETQRVAFRIDDAPDLVFETGIYNLTQNETPVLVHTGPDTTETLVLARLKQPDEPQDEPPMAEQLEKLLP